MARNRATEPRERRAIGLACMVIALGSGMVPVAAQLPRTAGAAHALVVLAMALMVAAIVTLSVLAGVSLRGLRTQPQD